MNDKKDGGGASATEKLQAMINESIEKAFGARDQAAKEEKDPWAKMQGMIDRAVDQAVGRRFDVFAKSLEEEPGKGEESGEEPKLGILGL